MHEEEQGAAANPISNPQVTDSFVLGTIEESRIPELERRGLIVQVLNDQPVEETPGVGSPLVRSLRSVREGIDSMKAPEVPSLDPSTPAFYVITLAGPSWMTGRRRSRRRAPRSWTASLRRVSRSGASPQALPRSSRFPSCDRSGRTDGPTPDPSGRAPRSRGLLPGQSQGCPRGSGP
jgi:hypothetical protein